MEVTPIERTIVEYSLTLSDADAALAINDPFSFGEKMRDYLLPHLPQGGSPRKPSAASQITIGNGGKNASGNGHKGGKKAKAPKAAKALPLECPGCQRLFKSEGWLQKHIAKTHATASAATSSSTE